MKDSERDRKSSFIFHLWVQSPDVCHNWVRLKPDFRSSMCLARTWVLEPSTAASQVRHLQEAGWVGSRGRTQTQAFWHGMQLSQVAVKTMVPQCLPRPLLSLYFFQGNFPMQSVSISNHAIFYTVNNEIIYYVLVYFSLSATVIGSMSAWLMELQSSKVFPELGWVTNTHKKLNKCLFAE